MEDNEIVKLYFDRSEDAIKETDQKYRNYCYSISKHILENDEDVKEIINDTYLKLWQTIPPNEPDALSSYIGMICRQLSLNRYKEKHRKKRGGGNVDLALDELIECIPSSRDKEIVDRMHMASLLNRFLESLPKKNRIIFIKRYWYLHPVSQIARSQSISESGVKIILFRTRKKLKKFLTEEGIDV
ncbi:MAG: sigma-70 family RNA polymerase sigma factor [Clostridia bacterium]|nr:sigma-70 family RNA polymerase sigma factor [Clostridia bacterium]